MRRLLMAAIGVGVAACATPRLTPVPLRPEPVAFADTLRIPEPSEQKEGRVKRTLLIHAPLQMSEPVDPGEGEALDLTHEDDVVSSEWWERRMGYERLTPEQLAWGPTSAQGAPAATGPLTVKSVKVEGVTPGFTMKDANGTTYIVKFDPADSPHIQSASGVIGNRLMWGAGFWVPEDYLTVIDPARLTVDPKATIATEAGKRPLTLDDVKRLLERARPAENGGYLALASRFVPGTPKGTFFFSGRRKDDPNDHYDHEHRRELRALRVFSAWINDSDRREGNTMDVYVKPGYLRHYQLDFAASLGSASTRAKEVNEETERPLDVYSLAGRVLTLGLYQKDWEHQADELHPDSILGILRGADFKPDEWKAWWTNPAFQDMTHADAYWGAKILASFSDAHVRAAVSTGGLPTQQLRDTLSGLIEIRRDILIRWAFEKVSTVEEPVVARQSPGTLRLSFRDLGLEQRLWTADGTTYDWTFSDPARGRSGKGSAQPRAGGDQLVDVTWSGPTAGAASGDELARLSIVTRRPDRAPDPATIFLRWTSTGYQVAGITHGNPDY